MLEAYNGKALSFQYKIKEIAKMMGQSEDSVKSLLARAKKQYKELVMKGDDK